MFTKIAGGITDWPNWAKPGTRYRRLQTLDRLLDGTFYDHIKHSFDEDKHGEEYVSMLERRPSVRYNLPRWVARRVSRKLFAGRQRPRIVHENPAVKKAALCLSREGFLYQRMLRATVLGAVGSVAMTFKLLPDAGGEYRIVFDVWRSRDCTPWFDTLGELAQLRLHYITTGGEILAEGAVTTDYEGEAIKPGKRYWFIRDYLTDVEATYMPVPERDFSPYEDPFSDEMMRVLVPRPDGTIEHGLGFVPGHWFCNLSGGEQPDGECIFEAAIDTAIVIDYTLSQMANGYWYNASPELIIQGNPANFEEGANGALVVRGPTNVLQFPPLVKDSEGNQTGGGDAKLLESTGGALKEGMPFVEALRRYALEQIQASRKDPDKLAGAAASGKAMEILDEDFADLVAELRTYFGDEGMLPLLRKALHAAEKVGHRHLAGVSLDDVDELELQWPKLFVPGAQEILWLSQALTGLMTPPQPPTVPDVPTEKPGSPAMPAPKAGKDGKPVAMGKPATPAVKPDPDHVAKVKEIMAGMPTRGVLTVQEARALFEAWLDIPEVDTDESADQQTPSPTPSEPATLSGAGQEASGSPETGKKKRRRRKGGNE